MMELHTQLSNAKYTKLSKLVKEAMSMMRFYGAQMAAVLTQSTALFLYPGMVIFWVQLSVLRIFQNVYRVEEKKR